MSQPDFRIRPYAPADCPARPFFLSRGYDVVKQQEVERRGVILSNFVMKKVVRKA